jgi:hypothetical protein
VGTVPDARSLDRADRVGVTTATTQLHQQHEGLLERSELLAAVARELPALNPFERATRVGEALAFLQEAVVPHTWLDERILYPRVNERLCDPLATATMGYDHIAIRGLIDDLAAAADDDVDELQRLLYALHALISVHIWKEERLYLTMLDRLGWPAF